MKLIKVKTRKDKKEFLDVARYIYKDDPNWVCPLDTQINAIFNPDQNVFYKHGEATRWLLKDDKGNYLGRVAAFINKKKAFGFDQPTGGMGFFECVNDKEAAFLLFDRCKDWLQERKMEAMDGPINFGENDNFWGLMVEGFRQPGFGMQYNYPYYQELFESYGFKFYFDQTTNNLDLTKKFPERFWKIANWVRQKPGYSFRHFNFKEADKFISDFEEVYTQGWEYHENYTPISGEDLKQKLHESRSFIEEDFIWFAYHDDKPIAFLVMYPDINQILSHFKGNMNFFNKIKFARLVKKRIITRARIVVMGVVPKFQRSGIESAIFWHMEKMMKRHQEYTDLELSWVGDFNPKMKSLHESVDASFYNRHITYRKLFEEDKEAHRSTIIPVDTRNSGKRK